MKEFSLYFRNFWFYRLTNIAKKTNGFFYFFRKVPLIGKIVPPSIYQMYGVKQLFTIIGLISSISFSLVKKIVWLFAFIGLSVVAISVLNQQELSLSFKLLTAETIGNGLFLWFLAVVVAVPFYTGFTYYPEKKQQDFIGAFHQSRITFIRGMMFIEVIYEAIMYLPAGLLVGSMLGKPLSVSFFLFFAYLAGNYFFLYIGRLIFMKQFSKNTRRVIGWSAGLFFILVIIGLEWLRSWPFFITWGLSPLGVVIMLLLCGLSLNILLHYKQERIFLLRYSQEQSLWMTASSATMNKSKNQYISQGLAMQKNLVLNEDQSFQHLAGSEYLNALLFSRYRSLLNKSLLYRFYIFIPVWLAVVVLSLLGVFKSLNSNNLVALLPSLFFVMYFATFGKKVVQMVFVNCDVSMLYYPFYREAKTIISGFNYRFKQTFYYNGIVSLEILFTFLLLHIFNHFLLSWQFFGVLLLLLIALSFLFSFHELFVYYLIQPFTGDMEVVSPLYKIVSGLFYGLSYMNMQLRSVGYFYVVVISIISLLYVGIGFLIIYKKAPKTFRIKG